MTRLERASRGARRAFVLASKGAMLAMASWGAAISLSALAPDLVPAEPGGFGSIGEGAFTLWFTVVMIGIPALVPFASLAYLVLSLFTGASLDRSDAALAGFAVAASGLAVLLAIGDAPCAAVGVAPEACWGLKAGFVLDQFSKGALGDIFDIYSLKLSPLSIDHMQGLAKLYILNFRMISAAFLVLVILIVYHWSKGNTPDDADQAGGGAA